MNARAHGRESIAFALNGRPVLAQHPEHARVREFGARRVEARELGPALVDLETGLRQSNDLVVKRLIVGDDGVRETDPPEEVPGNEVVLLQPYGSLFFASATVFEDQLPAVTAESINSGRTRGSNR